MGNKPELLYFSATHDHPQWRFWQVISFTLSLTTTQKQCKKKAATWGCLGRTGRHRQTHILYLPLGRIVAMSVTVWDTCIPMLVFSWDCLDAVSTENDVESTQKIPCSLLLRRWAIPPSAANLWFQGHIPPTKQFQLWLPRQLPYPLPSHPMQRDWLGLHICWYGLNLVEINIHSHYKASL